MYSRAIKKWRRKHTINSCSGIERQQEIYTVRTFNPDFSRIVVRRIHRSSKKSRRSSTVTLKFTISQALAGAVLNGYGEIESDKDTAFKASDVVGCNFLILNIYMDLKLTLCRISWSASDITFRTMRANYRPMKLQLRLKKMRHT